MSIRYCYSINMISNKPIEIRRVQALTGDRSFTLVHPRDYAIQLGIEKGDLIRVSIKEKQLILEKAEFKEQEGN